MEENYKIKEIEPLLLFGANNQRIKEIIKLFPKLKIVVRGNNLKINGNKAEILQFTSKLDIFIAHILKYGALTENQLERLMEEDAEELVKNTSGGEIILHGVGGKAIKAQTANQRKMVAAMKKNDLLFAIGPAGTGKTYTAVAMAVNALKNKQVKRIILTRPAVEAGENLGFLPGDLKEKLDPYMQPLYDALNDFLPGKQLSKLIEEKRIEIAPLAFMRGRTLSHAFVVLDEAQNASSMQMKMFLTRLGEGSRMAITGDKSQIDLPKGATSGLVEAERLLSSELKISFNSFSARYVVRHPLVASIIEAYDEDSRRKLSSVKLDK